MCCSVSGYIISCRYEYKISGTSVPSTGTWELVSIHGQHYYDDVMFYHWVDFQGTSMIDSVASKGDITSDIEASWNYDDILGSGNYNITKTFGSFVEL